MADANMNAAQLQHIQNEATKALKVAVESMQLRKWSVEQALALISLPHVTWSGDDKPMELAGQIFDFVSQAAVVRVDMTGGGK